MDRWSRDQPQPGSLFQRLMEAEKRDPGNEVVCFSEGIVSSQQHHAREAVVYSFRSEPDMRELGDNRKIATTRQNFIEGRCLRHC